MTDFEKKYGKSVLILEEVAVELRGTVSDVEWLIANHELKAKKINSKTLVTVQALSNYINDEDSLEENSLHSVEVPPTQSYTPTSNGGITTVDDATEEDFNMAEICGNGSCYQDKRGAWHLAFYIEDDGEKKRKILNGKSESDVRYEFERLRHKDTDVIPTITISSKHLVVDILDKLMAFKNSKNEVTGDWYKYVGKKIHTLLPNTYIEDMDEMDVLNFVNQLRYKEDGSLYSKVTIHAEYMLFKMIYQEALDKKYKVQQINFRKIPAPTGQDYDPHDKNLTDEELSAVLEAVKDHPKYRTLVTLLALTGLRIGEALALRWTDLNIKNGTLSINESMTEEKKEDGKGKHIITAVPGKTKTACSKREIYVSDTVLEILRQWKEYVQEDKILMRGITEHGNENMIFTDHNGNLQKYNTLQNHFRAYIKRHGVNFKMTFHMLRHVCASRLNENGADSAFIQVYLGHRDVTTTIKIYISQTDKSKKRAFEEQRNMLNNLIAI